MTNSIIHQYLEPVIEKLVENMENLYLQTYSNQDIEISKFRKIKDNHLQERMPNVFDNNSEYAIWKEVKGE